MKPSFVTRSDLKEELKIFKKEFKGEFEDFKEEFRLEMEGLHGKLRNDIFTRLDDISNQFEGMREDKELAAYQTRELREQVDDHEKRLGKLEKLPQTR